MWGDTHRQDLHRVWSLRNCEPRYQGLQDACLVPGYFLVSPDPHQRSNSVLIRSRLHVVNETNRHGRDFHVRRLYKESIKDGKHETPSRMTNPQAAQVVGGEGLTGSVLPSSSMWSKSRDVMPQTWGFGKQFVASTTPPMPTSRIVTSTPASRKIFRPKETPHPTYHVATCQIATVEYVMRHISNPSG